MIITSFIYFENNFINKYLLVFLHNKILYDRINIKSFFDVNDKK